MPANLAAALGSPFEGAGQGAQEYSMVDVIGRQCQIHARSRRPLRSHVRQPQPRAKRLCLGRLGPRASAQPKHARRAPALTNRADRGQAFPTTDSNGMPAPPCACNVGAIPAGIINSMPDKLKNAGLALWLAHSYAAQGQQALPKALYEKVAESGHNFYAVLATEELGGRINTRNNVGHSAKSDVNKLHRDGAVDRSLTLFAPPKTGDDSRHAPPSASRDGAMPPAVPMENTLLAAAQLAFDRNQFYKWPYDSAERTDKKLNYSLRYISPFRDLTERYAAQAGVDPAWVYGLIRQESRFMIGARSNVGARTA